MPEEMTTQQTAELLRRSPQSVRLYARRDGLPHRRSDRTGRLLFRREDVAEWLSRPEIVEMLTHTKGLPAVG